MPQKRMGPSKPWPEPLDPESPLDDSARIGYVTTALGKLRDARDYLAATGACPKAVERARAAIRSTEGALRHAENAPHRRDRERARRVGADRERRVGGSGHRER